MKTNRLPGLIDAHLAHTADDLPFWQQLARESGSVVLELGCGTGRVVRALAACACPVVGVDIDPRVLAYAEASLPETSRPLVQLHLADMRRLELPRSFGLILATCNTLASLNDEDLTMALQRSCAQLEPDGLFAAEVPPPQEVYDAPGEEILTTFIEPEREHPIQVSAQQRADSPRGPLHVEWRYDELLPDGRVERTTFPVTYHLREAEVMARHLTEAGFGRVDLLGEYDGAPWSPGAGHLILLARRAPREV